MRAVHAGVGADATIAREFDLDTKEFVPQEKGGFVLPEAKSRVCYKDRNTLLVGGVFGEEEMTDSGYPRTIRSWRRGTPLETASLEFEVVSCQKKLFRTNPNSR